MYGNNNDSYNSMYNENQISKSLPLKKRRTYMTDTVVADANNAANDQHDNYSVHRTTMKRQ